MSTRKTLQLFLCCLPLLTMYAQEGEEFRSLQEEFNQFWKGRSYEKGKGFKQFRRMEAFTTLREDGQGNFNPFALQSALQEQLARQGEVRDEAQWTPLGPFQPYPGSYVGGMGRVNCFAFHPENDSIWYAGAAMGGLWKTVDDGQTWLPLTDHLMSLGISSVALDPADPDHILIATGDRDGFRRRVSSYSIGVWESHDGGGSWQELGLPYDLEEQQIVTRILIHPLNPLRMYAATLAGIYRSLDGGTNWDTVTALGEWYDLELDPTNEMIFYAARAQVGVFKSTDGGETLTPLLGGFPQTNLSRIDLALAPSDPQTLYALVASANAPFYTGFRGVYRSTNGGESWLLRSSSPNILGWNTDGSDAGGQGWYALTIAVDPTDADIVWVGSVNVWRSNNGGSSWTLRGYWYQVGGIPYIHADHHILQFRGNTLFSGNDGGVYTWNEDDQAWTDHSNFLVISQVYRLGSYQGSPDLTLLLNGNQDNGSKLWEFGDWRPVRGGDGFECGVDPVDPQIMYASVYYGDLARSLDGGQTWLGGNNGSDTDGAWLTPILIDPDHSGRLYKGTRRIYRSDDHAASWESISGYLTNEYIHALAAAPSDDQVIYAADWEGHFYRTLDGGSSWETLVAPSQKLTSIAVHPDQPGRLYVSCGLFLDGEKVFVSDDHGDTWLNLSGDLLNVPVNQILLHPDDAEILFLATDLGVQLSTDGGSNWSSFSTGLPNVIVSELEIHANSNTLLAATFGRGSWQTPLPDFVATRATPKVPLDSRIVGVYPNPFNDRTRIELLLPISMDVDAQLFNLQGERVAIPFQGHLPAGRQLLWIDGESLVSGVYFARVRGADFQEQVRLFLIR